MPRCLGKAAGLAALTSWERVQCTPLKTATGWTVQNFTPLCTGALRKLCPGDTDMTVIPNPQIGGHRFIGGPGTGHPIDPKPPGPSQPVELGFGTTGNGNGGAGGPPDALCALAHLGAGCTWVDLIAAGIDVLAGGDGTEEPPAGPTTGAFTGETPEGLPTGPCPNGAIRIAGVCVQPSAALPGGEPFVTQAGMQAVRGLYGAGFSPTIESRQVRSCPPGFVLGKDNVCYDHLPRSKRKWDPGMKPLLTGGDRAAIRKAATAARKLKRAKKQLKKSARALEKVS